MRMAKWMKLGILSLSSVLFLAACADGDNQTPPVTPETEDPAEDPVMEDSINVPEEDTTDDEAD